MARPNEPDLSQRVRFGILLYPSQFEKVTTVLLPYRVSDWISQSIRTVDRASDRRLIANLGAFKSNELAFSRTVAAGTVGQLHGRGLGPCRVNSGSTRSLTGYCALDLLSESLV